MLNEPFYLTPPPLEGATSKCMQLPCANQTLILSSPKRLSVA